MIYYPAEIDIETGLFIRSQGVYVAAKPSIRLKEVQRMYLDIEKMGHNITFNWAEIEDEVKKPYRENPEVNSRRAEMMIKAAAEADVFIFFQDENLSGAIEEKGAFSSSAVKNPKGKKLYVVEDSIERQSIFDTLPHVEVVTSTDKIYHDLGRISLLANISK